MFRVQKCFIIVGVLLVNIVHFTFSITVTMDDPKFCDSFSENRITDKEEVFIYAKSNQSRSSIITSPIYVSHCKIIIGPKQSSKLQFVKVEFEYFFINDCKVWLAIRQILPSNAPYNELAKLECGDEKPEVIVTTIAKARVDIILLAIKNNATFDFKIKVSLTGDPNAEQGLSFAVKLVIGISCAAVVLFILFLAVKTIRYNRKLKKEEEEETQESLSPTQEMRGSPTYEMRGPPTHEMMGPPTHEMKGLMMNGDNLPSTDRSHEDFHFPVDNKNDDSKFIKQSDIVPPPPTYYSLYNDNR